ncbi:MAG: hypothetical protein HYY03_02955 [Chloroflexi bacterium]|nr:hypothetical protein [Chloroflexota bacterium]
MRCTFCGAYGSLDDTNCRRCGRAMRPDGRPSGRNSRLPVKRSAAPPVLWRQAAPVVAQGAALVAAGVIGEWLVRSLARSAFRLPLSLLGTPQRSQSKALARKREPSLPEGVIAISETVVMRRVILKR